MFSLFQTIKCELQIAAETGLDVQVSLRTITYRIPRSASIVVRSVGDPYRFVTDPGCEKTRYGSGSRANFDTDPDPGNSYTDPDPAKKGQVPGNEENL